VFVLVLQAWPAPDLAWPTYAGIARAGWETFVEWPDSDFSPYCAVAGSAFSAGDFRASVFVAILTEAWKGR